MEINISDGFPGLPAWKNCSFKSEGLKYNLFGRCNVLENPILMKRKLFILLIISFLLSSFNLQAQLNVGISGSILTGNNELKIRQGGDTIILTLGTLARWSSKIGKDNSETKALINAFSGSGDWAKVTKALNYTHIERLNIATVQIYLPPVSNYSISSIETVTVLIPLKCLSFSLSGPLNGDKPIIINPIPPTATIDDPGLTETMLNKATLTLYLKEETFSGSPLPAQAFTPTGTDLVSIIHASYLSETSATLTLGFTGNIDADITNFRITISPSVLSGSQSLTTNGINITAVAEPRILQVSIPVDTFGIGETVTCSITVENDLGRNYTYHSGTIAGRTIEGLTRSSATLYQGSFTVHEGDTDYSAPIPIPVQNLRLDAGPVEGWEYDGQISQPGGYMIDAHPPVIHSMQAPGGLKKIGDLLDISVSADDVNYTAVPAETFVNSIPATNSRVSFINLGNTSYVLRYHVGQGDKDVKQGDLTASLRLRDPAGNRSANFVTIAQNNISIDANPPVISKITVPDSIYTVGEEIQCRVFSDGSDYTATTETSINGVPLSSPNVTFRHTTGNEYSLVYQVNQNDRESGPNTIDIKVFLKDPAGNINITSPEVSPNSLVIYTKKPTAVISGDQSICDNDSAQMKVDLTGRSPWEVNVSDGSSILKFIDIKSSPLKFWVKPDHTTTYTVVSVIDDHKVLNAGEGSARVQVNTGTNVSITGLDPAYNVESGPLTLQANIPGGNFSGPGVSGPPWTFNPGTAGSSGSPHTIRYSYTNASGCTSYANTQVYVLKAEGVIGMNKDLYCNYNDPFQITASNAAGNTGSFSLMNATGQAVPGLADNGNNTAIIDPGILPENNYSVIYRYIQMGVTLSLTKAFRVEAPKQPQILMPDKSTFCENEASISLKSNISTAVFDGPGVSGSLYQGFVFSPSSTAPGEVDLRCTYTSENGCARSTTKTLIVNSVPGLNFSTGITCLGSGDTVYFSNTSQNRNSISNWNWNFGDPTSGPSNLSALEAPYHIFSTTGPKQIVLTVSTFTGCTDSLKKTIDFRPRPSGGFHAANDCYTPGDSTLFISDMKPADGITKYTWKLLLPDETTLTHDGGPETRYFLNGTGEYSMGLTAESGGGCMGTVTKTIYLKPTILLATENYNENFENGSGNWIPEERVASYGSPWTYGTPGYTSLPSSSSRTWYIDRSQENGTQTSYLYSPCFNFSGIDRPMIIMDIFRSLSEDTEGMTIQSSFDNNTWTTLGSLEDGINWYNSDHIAKMPSGTTDGWTGTLPQWIESRHDLNMAEGASRVRFRLAFTGSNAPNPGSEGFALDNVKIVPRTKNVLLEHFTNSSDPDSRIATATVNTVYNRNFENMIKLEYHTEFPGFDPFNQQNPSVPATRTLFYGITSVPYSILQGGTGEETRYDYQPSAISSREINIESLRDPEFRINLNVTRDAESITVKAGVLALKNMAPDERIFQVAIFEKLINDIPTQNGESNFLNVIKTLLPNAAGTAIFDGWSKGETRNFMFTWDYENVYDPDMIRAAAFIQNDNTGEVYQAVTDDNTNLSTARTRYQIIQGGLVMYPNPASSKLSIYLKPADNREHRVEFFDQTGRLVHSEKWFRTETVKEIDLSGLANGIYFIRVIDEHGNPTADGKFIIMH